MLFNAPDMKHLYKSHHCLILIFYYYYLVIHLYVSLLILDYVNTMVSLSLSLSDFPRYPGKGYSVRFCTMSLFLLYRHVTLCHQFYVSFIEL